MAKKRASKSKAKAAPDGPPPSRAGVHVFGVRHLSPMAAFQLRQMLDEVSPSVVLIEGLHDASDLIGDIVRRGTKPPIAILAYSESVPVRTLVYPIARYSPEYQALMWASENKAEAQFIDLPSDVFLALQDRMMKQWEERLAAAAEEAERLAEAAAAEAAEDEDEDEEDDDPLPPDPKKQTKAEREAEKKEALVNSLPPPHQAAPLSLYQRIAMAADEDDYESYWERRFEHNATPGVFQHAAFELGKQLRAAETEEDAGEGEDGAPLGRDFAENLVREAFMRRCIDEAIRAGHEPEKIVAVVGAFHAPVLGDDHAPMSDEELEQLPRLQSQRTLMPYSYFKLSSQSGYGAGNHAPAYYDLLWDCLAEAEEHAEERGGQPLDDGEGVSGLAARYLTNVVRELRETGTHRSTAEVIESVRLSRVLTSLKNGAAPVLADLQDAATAVIGQGDRPMLSEPMARVEVGTAIGELPKGVSQTSIQDDFNRCLTKLKLTKYRTTAKQDLSLDLRENRRAKTEEAAYLDLSRSTFLNRLHLLDVPFATPAKTRQESATWAENWQLQWTPEAEIALVEAVLMGETVELAAAYKFQRCVDESTSVRTAASLVKTASECEMIRGMTAARSKLQALAAQSSAMADTADATYQLMQTVRYGDVRRFDPSPLLPLMCELFVQASLALVGAANCDQAAAKEIVIGMDHLNQVALQYDELVDEQLWVEKLADLAARDDRNPLLSGAACAILLERGQMDNDELTREVSRRLSPGVPADLGAGWFEGLAGRNRYALLARQAMWEQLADYISELDDDQFRRSVVFLRRAFGAFSLAEKRAISENLGQCWGGHVDTIAEVMDQPLSEDEEQELEDLNEFDFDDF